MDSRTNKLLGALYGALIGDACGVPYEFKWPAAIPPLDQIDMTPPAGYDRTWESIPVGTYSDDGAQQLCLLKRLLECERPEDFDERALKISLQAWLYDGFMSVDGKTFDVGMQTSAALQTDDVSPLNEQRYNGNGSLMRTLPVALRFNDVDAIIDIAYQQSGVTHPHIRSRLCCVIYCLIAYHMIRGYQLWESVDLAFDELSVDRDFAEDLACIKDFQHYEATGTGYVVDSLWSAIKAVHRGRGYESVIKLAIAYGNDTDTTACIAGGLAGIQYGYSGIPQRWIDALRGKEIIEPLAYRMICTSLRSESQ